MSRRPTALVIVLAVAACLEGCGPDAQSPVPRSFADVAFCSLLPVARQVAVDLQTATAAARRGDAASMTGAAQDAARQAKRISDTLTGLSADLPRSGPRFDATAHLLSIAGFGQQYDVLFESGAMPDARALATVEKGLELLGVEEQRLEDALAAAQVEPC